MSVIVKRSSIDTEGSYILVAWCPGCDNLHWLDERWEFNEDLDKPTIKPSLLVQSNIHIDPDTNEQTATICHSFITNGKWEFGTDTTHQFSGQTVQMANLSISDFTKPDGYTVELGDEQKAQ